MQFLPHSLACGREIKMKIIHQFIERMNAHDVDGLCALMTNDHTFVDSIGSTIHGRGEMHRAWTGYFRLFPDYKIVSEDLLQTGNTIAVFGRASATYSPSGHMYKDHHWEVPAAWKAVIKDNLIAEWHVYADNYKTVRMIKGV